MTVLIFWNRYVNYSPHPFIFGIYQIQNESSFIVQLHSLTGDYK